MTGANAVSVFRAPMRSRDVEVPTGAAVERALETAVCGIGGRLDPPPRTLDEAITRTDQNRGERAARRLERFAAAPRGAFVWTRDAQAFLWLGRITGSWRYDDSAKAAEADLVHIRAVDWLSDPVPHDQAPPSVHIAFARGGRNWQRIRPPDASAISADLWCEGEQRR
ncbi:GAF domain-containing protein [Microbacterium sp.]|uniref:GAF domain-containing protein n=1 Tax=Microbacterium sp. TaxID=51671 RepID=UPI002617E8FE|nr:GAF domain-containing protein [Microbacterium sp.]